MNRKKDLSFLTSVETGKNLKTQNKTKLEASWENKQTEKAVEGRRKGKRIQNDPDF